MFWDVSSVCMSHDKATAARENMRSCFGVERDRHWQISMWQCGVTLVKHWWLQPSLVDNTLVSQYGMVI